MTGNDFCGLSLTLDSNTWQNKEKKTFAEVIKSLEQLLCYTLVVL